MATKQFYHDIDLVNVGQLIGARIQNVTNAQKTTLAGNLDANHKGLQVWDTDDNAPYIWNGSAFVRDALVVDGDVVFRGTITDPTDMAAQATAAAGNQYVFSASGIPTMDGVTFTPSVAVEPGDIVLFTSGTAATILQRNLQDALVDADFSGSGIMTSNGDGTYTVITNSSSNWDAAYADKINSASFGTTTGTITLNQQDGGTVTVDIDGRYHQIGVDIPDTDISETSVTQHEAALTITESQISDLGDHADGLIGDATVDGSIGNTVTDRIASALLTAQSYADTAEADAISSANSYTDGREAAITTAYQSYADQAEANAISTAAADATSKADTAESSANSYTDTQTGDLATLTTTAKGSLVAAINEVNANVGSDISTLEGRVDTAESDITALEGRMTDVETDIGTLASLTTTSTGSLVAAINELDSDIATNASDIATNAGNITANANAIGTLSSLTTTAKGSLVAAINELESNANAIDSRLGTAETDIGTIGDLETSATDLVGAINEVRGNFKTYFNGDVDLTANVAQTINHALGLTNKDSYVITVTDAGGSHVSVDIDSTDVNNLTLTSSVDLTDGNAVKVAIIGF